MNEPTKTADEPDDTHSDADAQSDGTHEDSDRCSNDTHDHRPTGVAEDTNGTERVMMWCVECNTYWDVEREWSLGASNTEGEVA